MVIHELYIHKNEHILFLPQNDTTKCSRRYGSPSREGPETGLGQEQAGHHNCGGGGWRDENTKLHEEAGEEVRFFW